MALETPLSPLNAGGAGWVWVWRVMPTVRLREIGAVVKELAGLGIHPETAVRASLGFVDEGADMMLLEPAMFCGDVLIALKRACPVPIAPFSVSGEYLRLWSEGNSQHLPQLGVSGTQLNAHGRYWRANPGLHASWMSPRGKGWARREAGDCS